MDLIDRQALLDAITASINQFGGRYTTDQLNMWGLFSQMIKDLPSAEPQIVRVNPELSKEEFERLAKEIKDSPLVLLPSAEPQERKTGEWIYCEDTVADCVDGYRCDQCGLFVPWDYKHKGIDFIKDYHFCPNCGCKMEVEHEEVQDNS